MTHLSLFTINQTNEKLCVITKNCHRVNPENNDVDETFIESNNFHNQNNEFFLNNITNEDTQLNSIHITTNSIRLDDDIFLRLSSSESESEQYDTSVKNMMDNETDDISQYSSTEDSDIEKEMIIECNISDNHTDDDDNENIIDTNHNWIGKDGTQWSSTSSLSPLENKSKKKSRQKHLVIEENCDPSNNCNNGNNNGTGGPLHFSRMYNAKQLFKTIITNEMCDIIINETNLKIKQVYDNYNRNSINKKQYKPFTIDELNGFFGILIISGLYRSNIDHINDLWKYDALPIYRATMSLDRFKMLHRFIRFDKNNYAERNKQLNSDKAASIRNLWTQLNKNLNRCYRSSECITIDDQLLPFHGFTKFTQYIPSKSIKYGIRIYWACDARNAYPLNGHLYTGQATITSTVTSTANNDIKLSDVQKNDELSLNNDEQILLELIKIYKGTGRCITTDQNQFITLKLIKILKLWNLSLVGRINKYKTFLPPKILQNFYQNFKNQLLQTNFAFHKDILLYSYMPNKNELPIILLSTMKTHQTSVSTIQNNNKNEENIGINQPSPEILNYYNKTKGNLKWTIDKLLSEYTVKRKTKRWTLAIFYNMIDIAGLAAYIIKSEHNSKVINGNDGKFQCRRKFLKNLAQQLCQPAVEKRATNLQILKIPFIRMAIESCLGKQLNIIADSQKLSATTIDLPNQNHQQPQQQLRNASGHAIVVGSCYICRELKYKQRKTRKACKICYKPVCDVHSITKPTCNHCLNA